MLDLVKVDGGHYTLSDITVSFPRQAPDGKVYGYPLLDWGGQYVTIEEPERFGPWQTDDDCMDWFIGFLLAVGRRGLQRALVA